MAVNLLIDGYNLIGCSRGFESFGADTLEEEREKLIKRLSQYRGFKQARITVVFDGHKGGYATRRTERVRGLTIIYSKLGEEADQVIKNMISEKTKPFVVVTSDNDIIQFAERNGMTNISSPEFEDKLEMAAYMSQKGVEEEEDDPQQGFSTKKKGNPRRLSKKERKRKAILKKI